MHQIARIVINAQKMNSWKLFCMTAIILKGGVPIACVICAGVKNINFVSRATCGANATEFSVNNIAIKKIPKNIS